MSQTKQPTNTSALATLVIVFFFWGFVAASNGILIPFCQHHFSLTNFESQLLGSAFFGAYFIGSLILYLGSSVLKYDIVNKVNKLLAQVKGRPSSSSNTQEKLAESINHDPSAWQTPVL